MFLLALEADSDARSGAANVEIRYDDSPPGKVAQREDERFPEVVGVGVLGRNGVLVYLNRGPSEFRVSYRDVTRVR